MNTKLLLSSLVALFTLAVLSTSCKKTIVNNYYCDCDTLNCTTTPPTCTEKGYWFGEYAHETQGNVYVADSTFIGNGIAKLGNTPYSNPYFIGYYLHIPQCRNVNADSLKWEVRLKNPSGEGALSGYDVALAIFGTEDSVIVLYGGSAAHQSFLYMGYMNSSNQIKNVPELVQLFTDWTTVSLETKNGVLNTYKNGVLIKSFNLGTKKLGRVKKVHAGFKGVGSLDWGKGYNQAGQVIFREEFNNGNKSNVEWF